ncbi:MAG: hypothetical protein R6X02_12175 [Enhygromyxa sp.]
MGSPQHAKTLEHACDGEHLAIWGLSGHTQVEVALSELLADREMRGSRVPVISLLMRGREDGEWIERAITWLSLRGRRVIVRTRVVMPRSLVAALAEARRKGQVAVVELELAHHKPAIQRALLGEQADPVSGLLLQAQHLETLEIPVVARLAPMLPGIHDQADQFTPLLRNLVGADLRRVVLDVGQLHGRQLRELVAAQRELSVASLLELARAYGVDPMVVLGAAEIADDEPTRKLKPRRAQVFAHGLEQIARDHDNGALSLPSCGCRSHCDLSATRATNDYAAGYESVMGRDLFAGL